MEKLNFKPGFNVYNRISVKNYRDQIICGAAVVVGNGANARAHLHSATGISEVLPGTGNLIDRVKLAEELDVDLVLVNRGRISTVDEMHYQGGYVANFQGVKMTWFGFMIAGDVKMYTASRVRTVPDVALMINLRLKSQNMLPVLFMLYDFGVKRIEFVE